MDVIIDLVVKYWVGFVLAAVGAAVTATVKRYIKLSREERLREQKEQYSTLKDEILDAQASLIEEVIKQSSAGDTKLQEQIDELKIANQNVQAGVLSIQGRNFKAQCRALLNPNHVITLNEWEDIELEHHVYNNLGGNHKGDELFGMVKEKAKATFANIKVE